MAEVTENIEARIDRYLDYLFDEWGDIPNIAKEWPELSHNERVDFILEWPIKEDRLLMLRDYAERGFLNAEQCPRYQALLELVARTRPLLAPLLED